MISEPSPRERGFALAGVLGLLVVLSLLATLVFRNVGTDIIHSGRDLKRVRAEFAAESAVQWALTEIARPRPGKLPFTMATHQADGLKALKKDMGGKHPVYKLKVADLAKFPGAEIKEAKNGWIYASTHNGVTSISSGSSEILSFKVWLPNDSTLRITGRAQVEGTDAQLDMIADLRKGLVSL